MRFGEWGMEQKSSNIVSNCHSAMLGSVDPYYLVGGGGVQCTILFCNKLIE